MISFFKHTVRAVVIPAAILGTMYLLLVGSPIHVSAADSTAKIHVLALDGNSNAVILESVDSNGQKIFGMVDSGEDWDYPNGSNSRYPLRPGIIRSSGYDQQVLSYLDSLGVTSSNLQFYVATHPHSDHIGTGDTIVRKYAPKRVYLLPYADSYISNSARLWDNLYVYDQLVAAAKETRGVTLIQHLSTAASSVIEGYPDFSLGNFQIQIVNYDEDYIKSPKNDANEFSLGVIASANGHRAFLTSDITDVEGDASRIVSNYKLYNIDFMTSNHHGYPGAVSTSYLTAVHPNYFIQTGKFSLLTSDALQTLASLGSRVFSTVEYSKDITAIIVDFSGSTVTSNVDGTYELYRSSASRSVIYYNGTPYTGLFTYRNQKYYAGADHLLVRSTTWRDEVSGMQYTTDQNGVIIKERPLVGWIKDKEEWYYYQKDNTLYTGWLTLNNKTYYLNADGRMAVGWLQLDEKYYYFSTDGVMQTGWIFYINNWYYLAKDTGIMYANGWHADPDSKTMYYFYKWGGAARNTTLMLNGYKVKFLSWGGISGSTWIYQNDNWYYVKKYSCVTNGWYQIDNSWYFMNSDGSMKRNECFSYLNNLYFVNKSGKMYYGQWLNWNGNYYYLRNWGGAVHEGWLQLQEKWYYINDDCTLKTNESFIYNNNLYFVDKGGVMLTNKWVFSNGTWYYVSSRGGALKHQWFNYQNCWYYLKDDASMQTGWAEINGKTYYFLNQGAMVTGTQKIDGKTYQFDKNGALISSSDS